MIDLIDLPEIYKELPKKYDASTITSNEAMEEIFDEQDLVIRARLIMVFEARARELDDVIYQKEKRRIVLQNFKRVLRAWQQFQDEALRRQQKPEDHHTEFGYFEDGRELKCGVWVANMGGVKTFSDKGEILACYHPILPVGRLKNLETGQEHLILAYYRNNQWMEQKVAKEVVATASKITKLADYGIMVTSENAKALVRYLADVESLNDSSISLQKSTAKLGWHGDDFIPYDTNIVFDGDNRFKNIYDAVHERGSYEKWLEHIKELRRTGRTEIKFMLAASFASVLVNQLSNLPFFVDLWGETESGKTVTLMVAASVWANPSDAQYIGDFKTTDVALEAKADMLNNLPMILDDTSKASPRVRENFEGVIYDLCSGKGKSRSNKELGINRENRWKNCILCNGERPLSNYVSQGGAINRIIEVESQTNVYKDPQKTAELVKKNYGFAGKNFIDIIKTLGPDAIAKIYHEFSEKLLSTDKMQKQALSVSVILTADKIATDYIFKDGAYITLKEARESLVDRTEVSDNERCYEYLIDKIAMNSQRFDYDTRIEKWGIIDGDYAIIYNQAFKELCQQGGFSDKSFLRWADREGKIQTDPGRLNKAKTIDKKTVRCVFLKLDGLGNEKKDIQINDFVYESELNLDIPFE